MVFRYRFSSLNRTETHKTVQNIKARGTFTVSIADAAHMVEADYFGVESGNKAADKFARSGLTAGKAEAVDAPVINEFPICLECKFIEYQNNEYDCAALLANNDTGVQPHIINF